MTAPMKIKRTKSQIAFSIIGYTVITLVSIYCLFPLVLIVSGSFTQNDVLMRQGYSLWPRVFSTAAYRQLFRYPEGIINAYGTTIMCTVVGTALGLFIITMTGYVLQRPDFKYRSKVSFMIYFTTIFGGGMVPWFIMLSKYLHFQNTYMARILPLLMSPFLIILMRTFISSTVPHEIIESAKIDSAGDFAIYWRIVLPVITPGIATVGLFLALGYWNDWYLTSLFITKKNMYSLQFYLYDMLNSVRFAQEMGIPQLGTEQVPTESIKMAMVVIVTGPIIFLYPFVQRYFIAGITVGSVKG
ncbi:carbohydrate ABC transporter permease [Ruminococcaceae bacterium OttesenSCG-928-L11]|nr:carbohydrate ABC transporter permease [Ruminococcaceae bacterium OttesenSCG-928-L11]